MIYDSIKRKFLIYFVVFTNALAFTCLGGALSWASPSMAKLLGPNTPIPIKNHEASWVGSFVAIGAAAIAIPYTYLFNTMGRKWLIMSTAASYLIGWIVLIMSTNVTHLYIGRFLIGTAVGPTFGVIPAYIAEMVNKNVRGMIVYILVISRSIGSLIQYFVGPEVSFKTLNMLSMIAPCLLFLCSFALPESPYYLLSINKDSDAKNVLLRLRGKRDVSDIEEEFVDIKKCLHENPPMGYSDLFKELTLTKTRKVMAIIAISVFAHQFCGVSAIIVYMETIFTDMKSPIKANITVIWNEILSDITVLITMTFIDKVGRKPLLTIAAITCIIADIIIGLFFFLRSKNIIDENHGWIGVGGIFLVHIGEGLGLSAVPVIVMSEIMSFSLKGWLMGFYLIVQGIYNATSIKVFQMLNDDAEPAYAYWMYASCILISVIYLLIYMPETKRRSLREIQIILSGGKLLEKDNISLKSLPENTQKC